MTCLSGEKFGADGDQTTATAMKAIQDAAADEAKQRLAEKAAKKAAFNAEYDVGKLELCFCFRFCFCFCFFFFFFFFPVASTGMSTLTVCMLPCQGLHKDSHDLSAMD